jgi:predicted metal-dependent HD superfamily phosphohydrolase
MDYVSASQHMLRRLQEELPAYCYYHDYAHTMRVLRAVDELAEGENIDDEMRVLLRTAAVYHDCGFIEQYPDNEPVAARMAMEVLPRFNYSQGQIDIVVRLILATALTAVPNDIVEKIIKDADFDYLGRNEYEEISFLLKAEWQETGRHFTMEEWFALQEKFLSQHRFYTNTAQRLRDPVKQQHLEKLRRPAEKK